MPTFRALTSKKIRGFTPLELAAEKKCNLQKTDVSAAAILRSLTGFTFIELMAVAFLLSILIAFLAIKWDYAPKNREGFLERFSIETSLIREDAISEYRYNAIEFDIVNNIMRLGNMDRVMGFVLSRELQMPENFMLKDVIVNGEKIPTGKALMRFYPTGLVDRIILHFEAEKEGLYSIIVNPLTAKVEGHNGYVEDVQLPETALNK